MSQMGLVSRVTPVHTAMRNCTRDEGRSFEVGNQVLISSHRKLLSSKAMVVNVAEKSERGGRGRRTAGPFHYRTLAISVSEQRVVKRLGYPLTDPRQFDILGIDTAEAELSRPPMRCG